MLNTEIKLIFRSLYKNKVVSTINILGLTIGLTFVILVGRYIYTEMTYDQFHENYKRISRVECKTPDYSFNYSPNILYTWLKDNIPDIKHITRILEAGGKGVQYRNNKFIIDRPLIVDPDFFSMFSFQLSSGEIESFAKYKYSVALSESLAFRIFGNKNPIGESVIYNGKPFTVRAVLNDPPANSSLKFDLLLPTFNMPDYVNDNWGNNTLQIFMEANDKIQRSELHQKIRNGVVPVLKSLGYDNIVNNIQYILNPLQDIYYTASEHDDVCIHGDRKYTYLLLSLSILVLIIALINYSNSLIASASQSLKVIGLKSVIGASKISNIRYLIIQSAFPSMISAIFAIVLSFLFLDLFEQTLDVSLSQITLLQILLIILGGTVFGAVVGAYPAYRLSSTKIPDSLKGVNKSGTGAIRLRAILSVAQFVASIALIISLFTINRQVNYVFKQSVENFDEDIVVFMPVTKRSQHKSPKIKTIQEALKSLPEVNETSTCLHLPGDEFYSGLRELKFEYLGEEKSINVNHNWADVKYPDVMGYIIVNGRFFSKDLKSDYQSYIVNETFIKRHGVKDISKAFLNGSPIIGVIKDFHYNSLQKKIEPMAIRYENYYQSRIVVRLASSQIESLPEVVNKMEKIINEIDIIAVSDIQFLEQHIVSLYEKEMKTSKIIFVLSVFSILISCMGLFSISLFVTNNRKKEIGIRKVNGANVSEILIMLNKDFVKWVSIAFILACPIAYYAMNKWLENFAYKTTMSWWVFALAGFLALGIALLIVSWQSWKAATNNPVEALRTE